MNLFLGTPKPEGLTTCTNNESTQAVKGGYAIVQGEEKLKFSEAQGRMLYSSSSLYKPLRCTAAVAAATKLIRGQISTQCRGGVTTLKIN